MGTTLTGTTPQDTYDSLIKVTDNGPLSGTAKYLSDGLGNDSALALSTGAVGIGTTSLFADLQVNKASDVTLALSNSTAVTSGNRGSLSFYNSAVSTVALIKATAVTDNVGTQLEFYTRPAAGSLAQTMTIASTGNVGIGTSSPTFKLSVNGGYIQNTDGTRSVLIGSDGTGALAGTNTNHYFRFITNDAERLRITEDGYVRLSSGSGGIQFNSDTAAANALDDYEEGTFTAVLNPSTSGTFTLNATFNTWSYTKIGRQVTIKGLALVSSVASPVGTEVYISGLPFTILNSNSARGSAAVTYLDQSASTWSSLASKHSINNTFLDIQIDASTVAANDEFYVTLTYFTA